MREYLYIPLGGNRVPAWRKTFNLWFVFLVSGFWHGAAWNFVVWGGYHGLFLSLAACRTLINRRQLQDIPSKLMTPRIDESYRLLIRERKGGKGAVSGVLVCYALA